MESDWDIQGMDENSFIKNSYHLELKKSDRNLTRKMDA